MNDFFKLETLSQVFDYLEFPGPRHPSIAIIDFSKTPFDKEIPEAKVVCDFYQISFKCCKSGSLKYGRQRYDYQKGSLVYLAPGQVVDYSDVKDVKGSSGWGLFFHADLIRSYALGKKINTYDFFKYQSNEGLHISEKEKEIIESIIAKIQTELDSNLDDFSEEVIVTNLELLLNYSKRFYNRQFIIRKKFTKDVVMSFHKLLEAYFEEKLQKELGLPTVQYFAKELKYSPNYLNELIKKSTGKNVIDHIHHRILDYAKNLLLNSNMNVSEIAHELGFEYSQYFSRLFKKKTGMTPLTYRKSG